MRSEANLLIRAGQSLLAVAAAAGIFLALQIAMVAG